MTLSSSNERSIDDLLYVHIWCVYITRPCWSQTPFQMLYAFSWHPLLISIDWYWSSTRSASTTERTTSIERLWMHINPECLIHTTNGIGYISMDHLGSLSSQQPKPGTYASTLKCCLAANDVQKTSTWFKKCWESLGDTACGILCTKIMDMQDRGPKVLAWLESGVSEVLGSNWNLRYLGAIPRQCLLYTSKGTKCRAFSATVSLRKRNKFILYKQQHC